MAHVAPIKRNGHALRKRDAAIAALLSCRTVDEAALQAQVGETTLHRWLNQPDFQQAIRQAQERMLDTAINTLRRAADSFADTLVEIAEDKSMLPLVRLAAAGRGLEILMRIHGHGEMERQLLQLEETVTRLEMEVR